MLLSLGRRVGVLLLVLLVLLLGVGSWLLGTRYGRRYLTQRIRAELARRTELRVEPFEVGWSGRNFPHLTVAVRQLTLTDTLRQRAVPVLHIGRADLRLNLLSLLRGRPRIDALHLQDARLYSYVDAQGHRWTLHGHRRSTSGKTPPEFDLPRIQLHNVLLDFRNDYKASRFQARIADARLTAHLRAGQLRLDGTLAGSLDSLRGRSGTRLAHEPVTAWLHYRYAFGPRQGTFAPGTRATLHGDTIGVTGTHTTARHAPAGSWLNLRFAGPQDLMRVLPAALPPTFAPYLAGARSPSKVWLRYTVRGLSSPTVLPRSMLRLELRRARLVWPDSTRRISRWDLSAVLDNGAARSLRTSTLTLHRCRIYSSAGRLDAQLRITDFRRPVVAGRLRGRTDLPALAALVAPGDWRAYRGAATLDVQLRGPLPSMAGRQPVAPGPGLRLRGTVQLRGADFDVPGRRARVQGLHLRLALQDSLWRLDSLRGRIDGMRFRVAARTLYLLDYLTGRRPSTQIDGRFAVDELRVARLGELLRPAGQRATRHPTDSTLLPPGLRLRVALRCARLILPTDTLRQVTVQVRRNARRTELWGLAAHIWGGAVYGRAAWPGPAAPAGQPGSFGLALRFGTLDYQRVARLIGRSLHPTAKAGRLAVPRRTAAPVRRLLLTANGSINCRIGTLLMPVGENLRQVRLDVRKVGREFRMPALHFTTTSGGVGRAEGTVQLRAGRLYRAAADVELQYRTLDVQRLLLLLASLQPDRDDDDEEDSDLDADDFMMARGAAAASRPRGAAGLLAGDVLTARLRVRADYVRYGVLSGTDFRASSYLRPGLARLDQCDLQVFGGALNLRGTLQTHAVAGRHPLHTQVRLQHIELPRLLQVADALHFAVLGSDNVRGTMSCAADFHTALDSTFLPSITRTQGYARVAVDDMELLNVAPLQQALRILGRNRTSHLYFRPVSTEVFLDRERLLVPRLLLNSNLSDLEISGEYYLTGRTDLYIGLNPLQALLGNNRRRIQRIRTDAPARHPDRHTLYVNLRRPTNGTRYQVRPFKRREKQQQQQRLQREYHRLLQRQPIDTTLHLLPPLPAGPIPTDQAAPAANQ